MAEGDRSEAGQKPDRPLELIDPMTNELLVARIHSARMISPSTQCVDMPIDGGYVGMVDREPFDEWLRERAARHGAVRLAGRFRRIERDEDGDAIVIIEPKAGGPDLSVRTRVILGTDGARSEVARQSISGADEVPFVYAYHEILHTPKPRLIPLVVMSITTASYRLISMPGYFRMAPRSVRVRVLPSRVFLSGTRWVTCVVSPVSVMPRSYAARARPFR